MLKAALTAIVEQREVPISLCCFLDALDEHEGNDDELATFIHRLTSLADNNVVQLRFCLASRSGQYMKLILENVRVSPFMIIQEKITRRYKTERLCSSLSGFYLSPSPADMQPVANFVGSRVLGVFIWVRLVVNELVQGIRDGSTIPNEASVIYSPGASRFIYAEPQYAKEAYVMLQITLCNRSPLTLLEFTRCANASIRYMNGARILSTTLTPYLLRSTALGLHLTTTFILTKPRSMR